MRNNQLIIETRAPISLSKHSKNIKSTHYEYKDFACTVERTTNTKK